MNTAFPAASRLCLGAKNSSDAASARLPLAQSLRLDTEAGVGIEHDEVGVAPGRDPPFAGEPREPGGSFGAPASEIAQIPAAVARPGPRGGEPHLERRDAAPRPHEVARVEAFELGGR